MGAQRTRLPIALFVSLTLALAVPSSADDVVQVYPDLPQPSADNGLLTDETPADWFVELVTPSTSEGASAADVAASHDAFKNAAAAKGITYAQRFEYGDLWNGFSVQASGPDVAALQGLAGVKNLWPGATVALPSPDPAGGETIDLATAIQMTGADYVQNTLGITGKNIKVAVMDTGVDYHNPDLGGCFGPPCRVFTGGDFVGDSSNADPTSPSYQPVPHPDPDPDDCNGHGTHVAGIVGANGFVKGVAPDVRFGAYRVFGCQGSTTADIMLAAMERALSDHMDVLNMSIGSAFQWPQYPTAVGADRLVTKHGMVVVASIGNNGANGLYSSGAPGVGANVIGVASFDNIKVTLSYFTASPDATKVGYVAATAAPAAPTTGSATLARTGTTSSTADACAALSPGSLTGKVALIRRGTCSFYLKSINAQNAGATGVVLYNSASGYVNATVAGSPAVTIPVVGTSNTFGALLDARIAAGATTLTWTDALDKFPNPTGGLVSSFSSYGLAPDLSLKPDISAPGGFIYSTLPLAQGGHGVLSGTSMSSPHVAGAVALLLEARPKSLREIGADRVRGILQNSATPEPWWGSPSSGLLDNVQRQGAGMLNIRAAIEASAEITPGKLSLGESQSGPATRTLTISSLPGTAHTVTYTFSNENALATGPNTFTPSFFNAPSTVTFGAASVTLKNNKSATVDVTIAPNAGLPNKSLYGGWIKISGDDGSVYRVPYAGFKGDYQSIVVLSGITRICRLSAAGGLTLVPSTGGTFTFGNSTQIPIFCVHFDHQSRAVTFTVKNVTSGVTLADPAARFAYFGRNSTSTGVFGITWDGSVGSGAGSTPVENDTYEIAVEVLKALGDPLNPADTERVVLGRLTLNRP